MMQTGKIFFHGTDLLHKEDIEKEGLIVGWKALHRVHFESIWEPGISYVSGAKPRAAEDGVYLTDNREDAYTYAWDASKDCYPEDLESGDGDWKKIVVVEVDLPNDFPVGGDGFGSHMTENVDIPPKYIKRVWTYNDLRKREDFPPW